MSKTRTAVVTGGGVTAEVVTRYLPANYRVTGTTVEGVLEGNLRSGVTIEGEDVAGWGLDTYVIPRLASGLYWATETTVAS